MDSVWLMVIGPEPAIAGVPVETIMAAAVPAFTDFAVASAEPAGVESAATVVDPESVAAVTSADSAPDAGSVAFVTSDTLSVVLRPAICSPARVPTP